MALENLTEKENQAFSFIVKEALQGMGGKVPSDLHDDNYSWHNHKDIMKAGFNKKQAIGLLGSLTEKGFVEYGDTTDYGPLYTITDDGIDKAQELYS